MHAGHLFSFQGLSFSEGSPGATCLKNVDAVVITENILCIHIPTEGSIFLPGNEKEQKMS